MAWKKNNAIYTHDNAGVGVMFAGNKPGQTSGPTYFSPFVWHNIDLKPYGVPADANFVKGFAHLIITDGSPGAIDDLTCCVRPPGSTLHELNYQMQATTALNAEGARGRQDWECALVNGIMQLYWRMTIGGATANNSSPTGFLINMSMLSWGRFEPGSSSPVEPDHTFLVPFSGTLIRFEQAA